MQRKEKEEDEADLVDQLCIAAHKGDLDRMRRLVNEQGVGVGSRSGTIKNATPLGLAVLRGRTEAVRVLVTELGADVNQWAASMGGGEVTPLFIAALRLENPAIARMLLTEFRADPDRAADDAYDGLTPLHMAAQRGNAELVRVLVVEGKADVDKGKTDDGSTALYIAAQCGHAEVARVLVTEGRADANKRCTDDGTTPLHIASFAGHTDVVRMLVMEGMAKVNQPDRDGWRPFQFAAVRSRRDTCFALAALGADMDLSLPKGRPSCSIKDQPLSGWTIAVRSKRYGTPLKAALERRDHVVAMHLLRSRQTGRPTPRLVQEELLPVASTVGTHPLARPVCGRTQRVAEVAEELYRNRWSTKVDALCGKQQRQAVMAVMIIMLRAGGGGSRGESGPSGRGARRPRQREEETVGSEQAHHLEQAAGLPRWMHEVVDDVWWKVLEMMGVWR